MRVEAYIPNLTLPWLDDVNQKAYMGHAEARLPSHPRHDVWVQTGRLLDTASDVMGKIFDFEENRKSGRSGVMLAIGHRGSYYLPPTLIRIGDIPADDPEYGHKQDKYADYALFKAHFLIQRPELAFSQENLDMPEGEKWKIGKVDLPAGAVAFKNGFVLAISGLSTGEKDTAAVLAIGVKALLIRQQVARKLARRFNCFQNLSQILEVL